MNYIIMSILAFCGGAAIAFQAPINAKLGSFVGGALPAAFLSFFVGTIALGVVLVATQQLPSLDELSKPAPWMWVGGLMGALFVTVSISVVPVLGAALMICLVVAGQILAAMYIDKTGFLLLDPLEISWQRIVGAVLVIAGVALFAKY